MKIYMPTSTQCTVEAVTVTSIKTEHVNLLKHSNRAYTSGAMMENRPC